MKRSIFESRIRFNQTDFDLSDLGSYRRSALMHAETMWAMTAVPGFRCQKKFFNEIRILQIFENEKIVSLSD